MVLDVNTLVEAPEANTYIVELGLEGTTHPANEINRKRIRNELEMGEWYVQTGDSTEEQELMMRIDNTVDHTRLPAYLVLTSYPEEAEEGIVMYLGEVESKDEAWELLQTAVSEMRASAGTDTNITELSERMKSTVAKHGGLGFPANAITVVGFVLDSGMG